MAAKKSSVKPSFKVEVDLIDEDHDRVCDLFQDDFAQEIGETLHRALLGARLPPGVLVDAQIQLASQAAEQAKVPLGGGNIAADGGQVYDDGANALFLQAFGGSHHQGRLASLPEQPARCSSYPPELGLQNFIIHWAFDIRSGIPFECPADDEEVAGR